MSSVLFSTLYIQKLKLNAKNNNMRKLCICHWGTYSSWSLEDHVTKNYFQV